MSKKVEFSNQHGTWQACILVQLAYNMLSLDQAISEMVWGYGLIVKSG